MTSTAAKPSSDDFHRYQILRKGKKVKLLWEFSIFLYTKSRETLTHAQCSLIEVATATTDMLNNRTEKYHAKQLKAFLGCFNMMDESQIYTYSSSRCLCDNTIFMFCSDVR
jgi:hypothetical protein